ncbi:MAG: hypothetical protein NC420_14380 [Eubacterium sp.]|nr:hypothetical protein [Eubacterium sp.]MCM1241046.1 hypothetical protein [Lachnospiraceae bacterium]
MNILENVEKISTGGISAGSVIGLIAIALVGTVVLILACSGCLLGVKKLFQKLFDKKENDKQ